MYIHDNARVVFLGKRKNVFKPFDDGELQPDRPSNSQDKQRRKKLVRITPYDRTDRLPTLPHLACHHSNPLSGPFLHSDGSNSPPSGLNLD